MGKESLKIYSYLINKVNNSNGNRLIFMGEVGVDRRVENRHTI
jgi:hypothetical protein